MDAPPAVFTEWGDLDGDDDGGVSDCVDNFGNTEDDDEDGDGDDNGNSW